MLFEGRITSMDDAGRVWCVIPGVLGSEEYGPIPVLAHVQSSVTVDAGVYLSEVAKSADRFVVIGLIV